MSIATEPQRAGRDEAVKFRLANRETRFQLVPQVGVLVVVVVCSEGRLTRGAVPTLRPDSRPAKDGLRSKGAGRRDAQVVLHRVRVEVVVAVCAVPAIADAVL